MDDDADTARSGSKASRRTGFDTDHRSAPDMLVESAELHLAAFQPLLDEVDKLKASVWEAHTAAKDKLEESIDETEAAAKAHHHKVSLNNSEKAKWEAELKSVNVTHAPPKKPEMGSVEKDGVT